MSKRMREREYWPEDEERPELKPCPVCGRPGKSWFMFVDLPDDPGGGNGYFVGCPDCDIVFHSLWSADLAAHNWNNRNMKERLY